MPEGASEDQSLTLYECLLLGTCHRLFRLVACAESQHGRCAQEMRRSRRAIEAAHEPTAREEIEPRHKAKCPLVDAMICRTAIP